MSNFFSFFFLRLKWQMLVGDVISCGCGLEAIYLVVHSPGWDLQACWLAFEWHLHALLLPSTPNVPEMVLLSPLSTQFAQNFSGGWPLSNRCHSCCCFSASKSHLNSTVVDFGEAFWVHPVWWFAAVHCMYSKSQPKQTGAGTSSVTSRLHEVPNLYRANGKKNQKRSENQPNFVPCVLFADLYLCSGGEFG